MKDWAILNDVLLDAFGADLDEFRAFVSSYQHYPDRNRRKLVHGLPAGSPTIVAFFNKATDQVKAHGIDDQRLFEALANLRPMKRELILAAGRRYLGVDCDQPSPSRTSKPSAHADAAEVERFERVLSDRPTFLDVHYLREGVRRSRSVAKLRMKLGGRWYNGTGFLVDADRILTARHNLFEGGEPAEEVEVLFDYVRSPDGKTAETTSVAVSLENVESGTDADWAILTLRESILDRAPMPFAESPADVSERVSVLQHPEGDPMQVALHNSLVTASNHEVLQYLTDTRKGSSGSPVFNQRWEVVGLHHGWTEIKGEHRKLYRNEGTALEKLRQSLAAIDIKI